MAATPDEVSAHGRSVSYSTWEIGPSSAAVSLRMKLLELSRLGPRALPPGTVSGAHPGQPDLPARAFPSELILIADEQPCTPDGVARRRPDQSGWVRYEWEVECGAATNPFSRLEIRSQLLLAVAPSHMHFARARIGDQEGPLLEKVLTEASPRFVIQKATHSDTAGDAPADEIGSQLLDYVRLGIEHILSGWDHLAFVFGLLLLAERLGSVARLITGFTLAHSLTLALAVLDLVHPNAVAVEAVIAFSVALVAIEKGWLLADRPRVVPAAVLVGLVLLGATGLLGVSAIPTLTVSGLLVFTACYFALLSASDSSWLRICLTFAFGLVHGFGFAGILVEMTLPAERLVPALLGFNIGVEVGQIGVVLVLWPLLHFAKRKLRAESMHLASELSAAGLCGLGIYWLIERAFGA